MVLPMDNHPVLLYELIADNRTFTIKNCLNRENKNALTTENSKVAALKYNKSVGKRKKKNFTDQ